MHECHCGDLFNQVLLLIFMVALLFSFAGIGADVVLKAAASIAIAIIEGLYKLLQALLDRLTKKPPRTPKK